MQIAPEQGQFLQIIVKLLKIKKCLEIGRFTGLSTLCMARGLPHDGKIITIDSSEEFLPLAKKYWAKARVQDKIESVIGQGVDVMQSYIDRQFFFELIFIVIGFGLDGIKVTKKSDFCFKNYQNFEKYKINRNFQQNPLTVYLTTNCKRQ